MSEVQSVLAGRSAGQGHMIGIADRGPVGMVTLRGDLGSAALGAAVEQATGLAVPDVWACRAGEDGAGIVWMAPDEVLILTGYDDAGALAGRLDEALAGEHHLALVVSDARVVLRLTGAAVAEVLAKGAPVDLSPAAFPVGAARRTHLGGIAVAFWRLDGETWEIVAFRSFAHHLFDWLSVAAQEGGAVGAF